ncbi:MAG TPA: NAD(P)-dependent oxidoreductase [Candidatus Sulfotelmatobacter sp.]|nr:NAD(P)-dependent oxidoreductase [Candidatus Sulfotelmatobacter sp.]
MRVLITGGGGFLAGHLSVHLQTIVEVEVRTLKRAECDLSRDKEQLCSVLRSFQPGTVIHLAGRITGSESELDRDNRLATANLLESLRQEAPATRTVLGSTTAVYRDGGSAALPVAESQPAVPRGAYAASKYAAEQEARSHADAGAWISIARMSNPIGSNMDAALLPGTLAKQIVEIERGKPPILMLRDLSPKRDFLSARDCVRALWCIAECGAPGAFYNVASGVSTSIAEIVEIYLTLARVRPIEVRSLPTAGERSAVQEQWVSNAKLLALGWKPQETLRDAIRDQLNTERARP